MPSSRIGDDYCSISREWRIRPSLARRLIDLNARAEAVFSAEGLRWPGLWIISGYRSPRMQAQVNPSNPASLHSECPALAVDLRVGNIPASITTGFWPLLGNIWKSLGGRWGGDFPTPDPNHFEELTVRAGPVASAGVSLTAREEVTPVRRVAPAPVVRVPAPRPVAVTPQVPIRPSLFR